MPSVTLVAEMNIHILMIQYLKTSLHAPVKHPYLTNGSCYVVMQPATRQWSPVTLLVGHSMTTSD